MIRPAMAVASEYAREARWARFAALVLDALVLSVVLGTVNYVYGVTVVTSGYFAGSGVTYLTTTQTISAPVLTLLGFVYFIVSETMFSATPGKYLMRVRVVGLGGRPLTAAAVILRNLLRFIDILPVAYLLGGVLVLVTSRAQRLGDMAAGTAVVYRHRASEVGLTRSSSVLARRILAVTLAAAIVFSIGFDYFGRPPLVIQGLFNEHDLVKPDPASYSLGRPTWGSATVTYPIAFQFAQVTCTGTMTLRWQPFEWSVADATYTCPPS